MCLSKQTGHSVRAAHSLKVRLNDLNQLLGGISLSLAGSAGIDYMKTNMFLEQLRGEAIHGAPGSGYHLQHVTTVLVGFQGSFHGFDLAANASNPLDQLAFVFR